MGTLSINGPFSMAMLNNQSVPYFFFRVPDVPVPFQGIWTVQRSSKACETVTEWFAWHFLAMKWGIEHPNKDRMRYIYICIETYRRFFHGAYLQVSPSIEVSTSRPLTLCQSQRTYPVFLCLITGHWFQSGCLLWADALATWQTFCLVLNWSLGYTSVLDISFDGPSR